MFLFVPSDTFAVGWMYRLATKRTTKKMSRRKREREFFHDRAICPLPFVVTLEWI